MTLVLTILKGLSRHWKIWQTKNGPENKQPQDLNIEDKPNMGLEDLKMDFCLLASGCIRHFLTWPSRCEAQHTSIDQEEYWKPLVDLNVNWMSRIRPFWWLLEAEVIIASQANLITSNATKIQQFLLS